MWGTGGGGGGGGGYASLRDAKVDGLMTQTSTIPVSVCSAERGLAWLPWEGAGAGAYHGDSGRGGGGGECIHAYKQACPHWQAGRQAGRQAGGLSLTDILVCLLAYLIAPWLLAWSLARWLARLLSCLPARLLTDLHTYRLTD